MRQGSHIPSHRIENHRIEERPPASLSHIPRDLGSSCPRVDVGETLIAYMIGEVAIYGQRGSGNELLSEPAMIFTVARCPLEYEWFCRHRNRLDDQQGWVGIANGSKCYECLAVSEGGALVCQGESYPVSLISMLYTGVILLLWAVFAIDCRQSN